MNFMPATLHNVRLVADVRLAQMETEVRVEGESEIPKAAGRVRRVWLEPNDAAAYPPVIRAVLAAGVAVVALAGGCTTTQPGTGEWERDLAGAEAQLQLCLDIYLSDALAEQFGKQLGGEPHGCASYLLRGGPQREFCEAETPTEDQLETEELVVEQVMLVYSEGEEQLDLEPEIVLGDAAWRGGP